MTRAGFTRGCSSSIQYLHAFNVDLFLSKDALDVRDAINGSLAAAKLYDLPKGFKAPTNQIRIAFDGDAVLFSPKSECYYKGHGLEAFAKR